MEVLEYGHQLDRLFAAADDWQDPEDVLDPARFHGLNCSMLYRLCCARAERAHGEERRRLKAVRDKLKLARRYCVHALPSHPCEF